MRYLLHIKYENNISLENYVKNYLNINKFAFQLIEISPEQHKVFKLLSGFLNLLSKLYLRFNKKLVEYYLLSRNNCRLIVDSKWFTNFEKDKKIVMYGDSIVQTNEKDWYEARPKFSRTHFKNQDYIGDVVLSKLKYKSFSEIRSLSSDGSLNLDKFDFAISKRFTLKCNEFNVPILMDQSNDLLFPMEEINAEISVSILIPTDFKMSNKYGVDKTLLSLIQITTEINFEVILLYHQSKRTEFYNVINKIEKKLSVRGIEYKEEFNFSKVINTGVDASIFEFILILNDDVILNDKSDLIHFFSHLKDEKNLGSIGIRLFDEKGRILHAGIEYRNSEPQHFLKGSDKDFLRNSHDICREVSGCTGAFLAFMKTNFNIIGKMSENFPLDYNDVDLMLKIQENGLKNMICSKVLANHAESLTRGITSSNAINDDLIRLTNIHGKLPERDPFLYTPADRINYEKN